MTLSFPPSPRLNKMMLPDIFCCRSGYRQHIELLKTDSESLFPDGSGHIFNFFLAPSWAEKNPSRNRRYRSERFCCSRNRFLPQQNLSDQCYHFLDGFSDWTLNDPTSNNWTSKDWTSNDPTSNVPTLNDTTSNDPTLNDPTSKRTQLRTSELRIGLNLKNGLIFLHILFLK